MCGIGGLMLYPKDRTLEELAYIRSLIKRIAYENEVRGSDSTGFASFSKRAIGIFKQPLPAHRLIATNEFNKYLGNSVSPTTMSILIHTRAGTKGTELNNLNNHPIETQRFVGVHNGMIWNDDSLFEKYKLFRAGEVDSEIIFRMLDSTGDQPKTTDIKWVAEKLSGSFTTAFVPKKEKNKMFLIRNDNPATLVFIPELNIIVFASEKRFLEQAINFSNMVKSGISIDVANCFWQEPLRQSIYEFDMSLDNPYIQLTQIPTRFTESNDYYSASKYWGWAGYDDQDFFQSGAAEEETEAKLIIEEQEKRKKDILASILTSFNEEQLKVMDDYVDQMSNNAWTEGWKHGRDSIAKETDQKIGLAFEEGFEKGYEEGFNDGSVMIAAEEEASKAVV